MVLKDWNPIKAMGEKPHKRRLTRFEVALAAGQALTDFITHPSEGDPTAVVTMKDDLQELFLKYLNNLETVNKDGIAICDHEHGLYVKMD